MAGKFAQIIFLKTFKCSRHVNSSECLQVFETGAHSRRLLVPGNMNKSQASTIMF